MVPTSIMTLDRAGLRQLDGLIWAIIAAVAAAVLASLVLSDFRLVWASFLAPATIASAFAVGQWLYQTRRPDPRLAAALGSTAQIVAFSAVGAPLSYLAASLNFPLYDHWFEAADKALGLDWFGLLDWLEGHATAGFLLRLVYVSLMPQTLVVILALSLAGRFAALRIFVLAFVFAALVTIAISAFWPAQGVWLLHGMTASDGLSLPVSATSWPVFLGLRDGTFRLLMAGGAEGIITFPSLHSALALILAVALWPLPALRWIGVGLNTIMMVSIPIDGSHYFTDMLAGIVIAVACLLAARAMVQRANQPRPALAATPLQELATTAR
jgi:membrane-associated phospholipid phosphatase